MFAVKDKRSNKFLRDFTGSYSTFASNGNSPAYLNKGRKTHDEMWCLDSPTGAKLYRTKGGVKSSIGEKNWLEIVDVDIAVEGQSVSRDVLQEIKSLKNELRMQFDDKKLIALYKALDKLP
jgi:hypothetical protein